MSAGTVQLIPDSWLTLGIGSAVNSMNTVYSDMLSKGDPRIADWPLVYSPVPTIIISIIYVWLVKSFGPRFMENRKPYQLKTVLIIYNALQVASSSYLLHEFAMGGWLTGYSFTCQPVDYSGSPTSRRMIAAVYFCFLSKFTEFFDTFFFVLRKKDNQISFLHVFHHGFVPFGCWIFLKYAPGGHCSLAGLLNAFVHMVMYFYYLVSAMGPHLQKYLWWKKYLTTLQILQFICVFLHSFQLLFRECDFPRSIVWWTLIHATFFLGLFTNFYIKSYKQRCRAVSNKRAENLNLEDKVASSKILCSSTETENTNGDINGNAGIVKQRHK